jgi:hypothetical protein
MASTTQGGTSALSIVPRSKKGFPRKRNKDVHVSTRHRAEITAGSEILGQGSASEISNLARSESMGLRGKEVNDGGDVAFVGDIGGLRSKLMELEREKRVG